MTLRLYDYTAQVAFGTEGYRFESCQAYYGR
jgi:hypothetical protein